MSISFTAKVLSGAAVLALLAGCSSGSAIAPTLSTTQNYRIGALRHIPSLLNAVEMLKLRDFGASHRQRSFNHCPAAGPIAYVSDANNESVNIYKVPFAGQGPCGQLTNSSGLRLVYGIFVRHHDLFVADLAARHVFAFHRGATQPYITYTDPTCGGEAPSDVTVSNDNFVFAANFDGGSCPHGSISIWHKQSGVLVATIPDQAGSNPWFLTIQKDGTLYYDDKTGLYMGNCAGGACGSFTNTGAKFAFPGGLRSADGEDVVLDDRLASGGGALLTYEPPNFSEPAVCTLGLSDPVSFDINHKQHHVFVVDDALNEAFEFSYPGCKLIGAVPGVVGGGPVGIAKDFPETLH